MRSNVTNATLGSVLAFLAAGCTILTTGPGPTVPGPMLEYGTDRPGSDYRNFDLPSATPEICRDSCAIEPTCVAFTYVNPGVQGPRPRCWLKNRVPQPIPRDCCVSGVKGLGVTTALPSSLPPSLSPPPPPASGTWEPATDRPGLDYRSFDLPSPSPEMCRDSCAAEPQCRAFTYVNPGVQGPSARCWLKHTVPSAIPSNCCLSGVK